MIYKKQTKMWLKNFTIFTYNKKTLQRRNNLSAFINRKIINHFWITAREPHHKPYPTPWKKHPRLEFRGKRAARSGPMRVSKSRGPRITRWVGLSLDQIDVLTGWLTATASMLPDVAVTVEEVQFQLWTIMWHIFVYYIKRKKYLQEYYYCVVLAS